MMNWRVKAGLQTVLASLPMSNSIYYRVQRTVGNLRPGHTNPLDWYGAAIRIAGWAREAGRDIRGARFLEVGTGRMVNLPTALWLCGAAEVVTVDLNPYLSGELVAESNEYLRRNREAVLKLFGAEAESPLFQERFAQLLAFRGDLKALLKLTGIEYLSPADATRLPRPSGSFDFHISYAVFEHIPAEVIKAILAEAERVLKPGGLLMHTIDPSDHFANDDDSITAINFLQFSDREWNRLAGNKFMYHNRLRAYEYLELFRGAGVRLLREKQVVDEAALRALRHDFPLDERFRHVPAEELAISSMAVLGTFGGD